MKYYTMQGDYLAAYHFCLENGGQLFPGNGKDSANVVLIGTHCYTFWRKDSKRFIEVNELANQFNLPVEGQTGGRIARWLIDSLLCLPYSDTYWSKTYRNLAMNGSHWHYMMCDTKQYFWGIEVDIKSAYFSSLMSFKSLLYHPILGYLDDNNAMENLKILYPTFPKWFRLQLLGCLSSWRIYFQTRDNKNPDNRELLVKRRNFIKYNAGFNVAHRAILRNYKIMKKIHEIGGKHIRRMHTDSFLIDCDIPKNIEFQLWEYLKEKKLEYSIKGYGYCLFFDINTGFIGTKFVGSHLDVCELMRKNEIKMKRKNANEEVLSKSSYFANDIKSDSNHINDTVSFEPEKNKQLDLFSY